MQLTEKQILKWVYYFCVGQFLLILLYVLVGHHPVERSSLALVGASAIFGLLFSSLVRQNLQVRKQIAEKQQQYDELDETLKKLFNEEKGSSKN